MQTLNKEHGEKTANFDLKFVKKTEKKFTDLHNFTSLNP